MLVDVHILELAEGELALSDPTCFHVYHIIVVWRPISCSAAVGDADQHKLRWPHLPHGYDCYFNFFHPVLCWQSVWELVVVVVLAFFTQIISSELESILVSAFEPAEHRMIICLLDHIFICPNILAIEHMEGHRLRANPVNVKVREFQGIIIL